MKVDGVNADSWGNIFTYNSQQIHDIAQQCLINFLPLQQSFTIKW